MAASSSAYFRQTEAGDFLFVADPHWRDARQIEIKVFGARESSGLADTVHNHNPVWSPDNQWIYFVHGFVASGIKETRWTSGGSTFGRIAGAD